MSYVSLMNRFLIASHNLSANAIILYLRLFEIANNRGWPEDLKLPNEKLLSLTEMNSYKPLTAARNQLIQADLISYEVEARKHAGKYVFIDDETSDGLNDGAGLGDEKIKIRPTEDLPRNYRRPTEDLPSTKEKERSKEKENIYKDLDEREGAREDAPAPPPQVPPAGKPKRERHKYGRYQNVLLSDEQLAKLKAEFPHDWEQRIERVSEYCASHGKGYKDYLATIRNWARRDGEKEAHNASDDRKAASDSGASGGSDWSGFDNTYTQEQLDGGSDEAWAEYKRKYPTV